jgi:hypothetical protein
MRIESKDAPASDASVAILRDGLNEAARYISPAKILFFAARHAGTPRENLLGERALRDFLNGKAKTLAKTNYDVLAAWLASPLGHALQKPDSDKATAFGHLMRVLATGVGTLPPDLQVAGRYYMYHGSYLLPDRYVVRRLTIEEGRDNVLAVEDLVRDTVTVANTARRTRGVMLFVEGRPQILLYGNENKQGLSLVIGHDISVEDGALSGAFGSFMVMNANRQVAYRHYLLVREDAVPAEDMIGEMGIFTATELRQAGRAQHGQAFDRLKKLMEMQSPTDPMLIYPGPRSTSPPSYTAGTVVKT